MDFGFTEEQEFLRQEVRKFLEQSSPMTEVRKVAETPEGFSRDLFKQISELGWVGLTVPEEHGGAGLGWFDLGVVLEETGRALFPSPLLSTTLAGAAIVAAGSAEQQARWLPGLADGSTIGTFAILEGTDSLEPAGVQLRGSPENGGFVLDGEKLFVADAEAATLFVIPFRNGPSPTEASLAVIERDAAGLSIEAQPTIDLTKRMGRLRLESVRIGAGAILGAPGGAWSTVQHLIDRGACSVAAEIVGAAEAALDLTTRYAKERLQFGDPIGRYQSVKHPLAEMYVDVESTKSLVYYAAWALDESPAEAPLAVSRAKAYATEAFARIGIDSVQLHGAIGYTWEYDAQLYLKRAQWARPVFGDADYHYRRISTLGGY